MPIYEYYCESNRHTVRVYHPMTAELKTWGEVCYVAQIPLGDTQPETPVYRLSGAPGVIVSTGDTELKARGFTKLVRRDRGVYENVTATGNESRYFRAGKAETAPHLHEKIRD